jgi:hypothetical protein
MLCGDDAMQREMQQASLAEKHLSVLPRQLASSLFYCKIPDQSCLTIFFFLKKVHPLRA